MISFDPITEVGGVEGRARGYIKHLAASGHQIRTFDLSRHIHMKNIMLFGTTITFVSPSIRRIPVTLGLILKEILVTEPEGIFILSGTDTFIGIILLATVRVLRKKSGVFIYGKDVLSARSNALRNLALPV